MEMKIWSQHSYIAVKGLKIGDKEVSADSLSVGPKGSEKLSNIKPLNIRGEIDAMDVAKAFNSLIAELKAKGYMEQK
jgi:hypothetical protein